MRISAIIKFLEGVQRQHGDIKLQTITGFWTKVIPATGEMVLIDSVGDGKSVEEAINHGYRGN